MGEREAAQRTSRGLDAPEAKPGMLGNLERLDELVRDLVDRHVRLRREHSALRKTLADRDARLRTLDANLREANQCRQDAVKRIDDLIAQLERVEADLDRRLSSGSGD
jgi:chromosome segregation ATPase